MRESNEMIAENLEQQTQLREKEKQYHILAGLCWKNAGILFLGIIAAMAGYAVFF